MKHIAQLSTLIKSGALVTIVFLSALSLVHAQNLSSNLAQSGSVYSAYGIGYPVDLESGSATSHGVFGLSNVNQEVLGLSNPGSWSQSYYTQGASGLGFKNLRLKNATTEARSTLFEKGYLQLLFPLKSNELGLSVGLYPVTRSNLRILNEDTFESFGDTVTYQSQFQQFGGMNKFELGLGWKITEQISIGYAPSVAFFTMEDSETFNFSSSLYAQQTQKLNISGAAFSHRFGIAGTFRNLFRSQDKLSLGATVTAPFSMTLRQNFYTEKSLEVGSKTVDLSNLLVAKRGELNMPLEVAGGLGYAPHNRFNVSAEVHYQQWSDYSNSLFDTKGARMTDRLRVGTGVQFHPYKKIQSGFFSSFKYSAGLSYDTGHLTIQDQEIRTLWLHTGLGILSRSSSSMDVSLRYGFRGTTESSLIEENIWAIGLSVNLAEIMFLRPKLQ
jgi:hypothetical protein